MDDQVTRRNFLHAFYSSIMLILSSCGAFFKSSSKKSNKEIEWQQKVTPKNLLEKPAFQYVKDNPALPRVLLIGDSISIGYTQPVRELLNEIANLHRIPENGRDTNKGLSKLDLWLGEEKWDIIHFNWGLHDLKFVKDGKLDLKGIQVNEIKSYKENLEKLVRRLKLTGAKLIWASITPVPAGAEGRRPEDVPRYNQVAAEIMTKYDILINDLYGYINPHVKQFQRPQNVHFFPEGSQYLAQKVAQEILKVQKKN